MGSGGAPSGLASASETPAVHPPPTGAVSSDSDGDSGSGGGGDGGEGDEVEEAAAAAGGGGGGYGAQPAPPQAGREIVIVEDLWELVAMRQAGVVGVVALPAGARRDFLAWKEEEQNRPKQRQVRGVDGAWGPAWAALSTL